LPTEFWLFPGTENLGILFLTLPRKIKQLGIPFHRTKIEAICRNSLLNPSAEEKTAWNSVKCNKNKSKVSEFPSELFSGRENNSEFCSVPCNKNRSKLSEFLSQPFHGRETTQSKTLQPKISIAIL
jgi:hypothetical protein